MRLPRTHCFPCFLHLRRFPSHIITSASLTLQANLFSYEVFMEGGTDNPSARRNCADTIPSSVTDSLRRTSCWANTGVEEARLRPRCCKLVLLAAWRCPNFSSFFGFLTSADISFKSTHSTSPARLILSPLLMDKSRYLSNLTCRMVLELTLEPAEQIRL